MKILLLAAFALFSARTFAMVETKRIKTLRGSEIEITIHTSSDSKKPTLIVAPGQSCNSKGPLFETLGKLGETFNFTVVRFEWAYCLKDPTKPTPSADLSDEIEDFNTALLYAKTLPSVDSDNLIIAGKSLGSYVAYSVFKDNREAKLLALLTPICSYTTDEDGNPLPTPQQVCEESYPGLKNESRPVLMTMGDLDGLCILNILFDYLKDSHGNIQVHVAQGDHGFRVKKSDGSEDKTKTQNNINSIVNNLFNWANIKL